MHNPQIVQSLEARGLKNAHNIDEVDSRRAVRARPRPSGRRLREGAEKGLEIIDATCPMVTKIHVQAEKLEGRL